MIKMTILCDNYAKKRGLLAEHGLSIWIETDDGEYLFDTGQSDVFLKNAKHVGIDIKKVKALILSHGHYDHTGGIPAFLEENETAPIYVHPDAFVKRFVVGDVKEVIREISVPWSREDLGDKADRIATARRFLRLNSSMMIISEVPSSISFEEEKHNYMIQNEKEDLVFDKFIDEQMLVVSGKKGIYIFTGCSHAGVVNFIRHAKTYFPNERIAGVIGGMHIDQASIHTIQRTIDSMLEYQIKKIVPLHCSGMSAISEMKRTLRNNCYVLSSGDTLVLEDE